MPLGSRCFWRIVVEGGGGVGQKCTLVHAVIYPCSCQVKLPSPRQACRLQSSVTYTDIFSTPRLHDPFQSTTICGPPWAPRICQPCPFCSPKLFLEGRAQAPLTLGPAASVLYYTPSVSPHSSHLPPLPRTVESIASLKKNLPLSSNPLLSPTLTSPGLSMFP